MKYFEIEKLPEFDNHRLVSMIFDKKTGLKGFIAIHRGGLSSPALGATRLWNYDSETDALRDALRLSIMMSYKSAMAGLKYGGAKAVLINPGVTDRNRENFFAAYAQKVNYLGGKFITGSDVGVDDNDVALIKKETPYVIGTKANASYFTALGVIFALETCFKKIFGKENLTGKSFAIQGVGKTGFNIVNLLYKHSQKIIISDINAKKTREIKRSFPKVRVVLPSEIHRQDIDAFVPCALSGALNSKTVSELRAKIVVGSANNQLASQDIGNILRKLGILYAPDYVVNAGGLISVVDEFENESLNERRIVKKISKIKTTLNSIFEKSRRQNRATNMVANEMAEKIFNNHN